MGCISCILQLLSEIELTKRLIIKVFYGCILQQNTFIWHKLIFEKLFYYTLNNLPKTPRGKANPVLDGIYNSPYSNLDLLDTEYW